VKAERLERVQRQSVDNQVGGAHGSTRPSRCVRHRDPLVRFGATGAALFFTDSRRSTGASSRGHERRTRQQPWHGQANGRSSRPSKYALRHLPWRLDEGRPANSSRSRRSPRRRGASAAPETREPGQRRASRMGSRTRHRARLSTKKGPVSRAFPGGRDWDRTSDLSRVNEAGRSPPAATCGRISAIEPNHAIASCRQSCSRRPRLPHGCHGTPRRGRIPDGRYWDRTSDLLRVRQGLGEPELAQYLCAPPRGSYYP
jgi:hypothetical protein